MSYLKKSLSYLFLVLFLFYYPLLFILFFVLYLCKVYSWTETKKKLGFLKLDEITTKKEVTWFHISSLGEYNGLKPFLKKYIQEKKASVIISYFNPDVIEVLEREKLQFAYFALPFENPLALTRILRKFSIKKIIFYENEFWPITLLFLYLKDTKLYLINGFIHGNEYRNMLLAYPVFTFVLRTFKKLFVTSDKHRKRFISLGVAKKRITVVGNIKYDFQAARISPLTLKRSSFEWNEETKVFLLLSIHPEEWERLRNSIKNLIRQNIKIIIAPRLSKSIKIIENDLNKENISYGLMSAPPRKLDVLLVDTFGEMPRIYPMVDLCFVGGSIISYGGHNFLEPLAYNIKVMMGDYMYHFDDVLDHFKGLTHFTNEKNFEKDVLQLLVESKGDNGLSVLKSIQGVSEKILKEI